jgi:NAD-dependent DNA ligase
MKTLHNYLDECSRQYYNGVPIISDEQFDRLAAISNYNKVGSSEWGDSQAHMYQMYSLQKHYEDSNKSSPLHNEKNIAVTVKLDGAAISVLYVNGNFVRALTRGDGVAGRDVTDKVARLVPVKIPDFWGHTVQITGEVCAPSHIENARNYAAGSLNLSDLSEWKTRSVEFFAYGVYPYLTETFTQDMNTLSAVGFSTVFDKDLDKIYPTDGLVFRVDNNTRFQELGHTSKHPRGAYALKTRQECVETVLLDVEWQVGKTGKVTPVAILEPVLVGDATVSRATLNNPGFIRSLELCIGDVVGIRRAGEIIPEIVYKV